MPSTQIERILTGLTLVNLYAADKHEMFELTAQEDRYWVRFLLERDKEIPKDKYRAIVAMFTDEQKFNTDPEVIRTDMTVSQFIDYTAKNPAAVALGRLGGSVKSDKKSKSSAANGAKGGRPKMEIIRTANAQADDSKNSKWYVLVTQEGDKIVFNRFKQAHNAKFTEGGRIVRVDDSGVAACSLDEHKEWIAAHVK